MQCQSIKNNKKKCNARAMHGSTFCFSHNPSEKDRKHEAVTKGGRSRKNIELNLLPLKIDSIHDVKELLIETINEIRGGKMQPKVANSIAYLSISLIKILEVSEVEERIKRLEEQVTKGK